MGVRGTFNKVRDGGSRYPMTLRDGIDGYIEDQQQRRLPVTPVQNVLMSRVQDAEGGWCCALERVTTEDLRVQES